MAPTSTPPPAPTQGLGTSPRPSSARTPPSVLHRLGATSPPPCLSAGAIDHLLSTDAFLTAPQLAEWAEHILAAMLLPNLVWRAGRAAEQAGLDPASSPLVSPHLPSSPLVSPHLASSRLSRLLAPHRAAPRLASRLFSPDVASSRLVAPPRASPHRVASRPTCSRPLPRDLPRDLRCASRRSCASRSFCRCGWSRRRSWPPRWRALCRCSSLASTTTASTPAR